MYKKGIATLTALSLFLSLETTTAEAQSVDFIRDAEIENTIRAYATPLFQQAGVDPAAVQIHLVKDPQINAFVAEGLHLFLNTGLITRTTHPGQLIGVIAHESGHIAGGHLVRGESAAGDAEMIGIAGLLLGLGMMAMGGANAASNYRNAQRGDPNAYSDSNWGNAGMATMMLGQDAAMRNYFSFSRTIEGTADTAALGFLDNLHMSARGFLEFMQLLEGEELWSANKQDPYVRTHPLTSDRVDEIRNHVDKSPWSDVPDPPEFIEPHQRMVAKLKAFLQPPATTLYYYKDSDNSIAARYARAIAYYRKPDLVHAIPLIDGLIAERPNDPYFHELKGQMLFENARVPEAVPEYKLAVQDLPDNALLRGELGQVEVETEDAALLSDAVDNLKYATRIDPEDVGSWLELATAYGRLGQDAMVEVAMAEYASLSGRWPEASFHAEKALKGLKFGTVEYRRMDDIRAQAANHQHDDRR